MNHYHHSTKLYQKKYHSFVAIGIVTIYFHTMVIIICYHVFRLHHFINMKHYFYTFSDAWIHARDIYKYCLWQSFCDDAIKICDCSFSMDWHENDLHKSLYTNLVPVYKLNCQCLFHLLSSTVYCMWNLGLLMSKIAWDKAKHYLRHYMWYYFQFRSILRYYILIVNYSCVYYKLYLCIV